MLRVLRPILFSLLPVCSASALAQDLPGAELPVSAVLTQSRLQSATVELLATQDRQGRASGKLYDGAVTYALDWRIDTTQSAVTLHTLKNGARVRLTLPIQLNPAFTLRKGAERIYGQHGCGGVAAHVKVSLDLRIVAGEPVFTSPRSGVIIPGKYECYFDRNMAGDIRNWFTRDTENRVNVVPKMRSGIDAKLAIVTGPLQQAVTARLGAPALSERLRQRLRDPLRVADNVSLHADFGQLLFDRLSVRNKALTLQARVKLRPRFGFGSSASAGNRTGSQSSDFVAGFQLDFDLLIPRSESAPDAPSRDAITRPGYRFVALPAKPGTAVLERYQGDRSEAVVWLQTGTAVPPAENRVAMGAPITGVLEEIVTWLTDNSGVRSAGGAPVDRLREEVQRFAALVAHFERPRDLPLPSIGTLRLSDLRADLHWLSLQPDAIRAGVLLHGKAKVFLEL